LTLGDGLKKFWSFIQEERAAGHKLEAVLDFHSTKLRYNLALLLQMMIVYTRFSS